MNTAALADSTSTLTPHQNDVVHQLTEILEDFNIVCLTGSAGVGKSYTTAVLDANHYTATTNTAAAVLTEKLADAGKRVAGTTIHKLLGLRVYFKEGQTYLAPANENKLHDDLGIVVVDEASMIDKALLGYILENAEQTPTKYILVGDPYQLPPVKHGTSPAFNMGIPTFTLQEIVRQAKGNPIIDTATQIRDGIKGNYVAKISLNSAVIRVNQEEADKLVDSWFVDGNEDALICGYTNANVNNYNKRIKKAKFGDDDLFVGERIIINSAVKDIFTENLIATDSVCIISHIRDEQSFHGILGRIVETECGKSVFSPNSQKQVKELLKIAKTAKDWQLFYKIQENCADIRAAYARTTHKSQGSTVDYVLLDLDDVYTAKGDNIKSRLIYVALTRARKKVYVLKR